MIISYKAFTCQALWKLKNSTQEIHYLLKPKPYQFRPYLLGAIEEHVKLPG